MAVRVGINGFGRIGRLVFRAAMESGRDDIEFVAINDLGSAQANAYLLTYDSVHGTYPGKVQAMKSALKVDGRKVAVLSERDPAKLPWGELGVDIVMECTGLFASKEAASAHLVGGAKKVLVSAPCSNADITVCHGVNSNKLRKSHKVISNASCTTNCLVPVAAVLNKAVGIRRGFMTTVHSYTNDQQLLDLPHKDLRRARAAALSMIPTSTGAARATSLVIPEVKGKLDGVALRVPTADVSLVDLVCVVERSTTSEEVNAAFQAAAESSLKGILAVSNEPLVSVDYIGDPHSSTVDALSTHVIDGTLVHVSSWYDNEMGYSARCVDIIEHVGGQLG